MRSRSKTIITSSLVLALVLAIAAVFAFTSKTWPFESSSTTPSPATSPSPSTEASPSPPTIPSPSEPTPTAPSEPVEAVPEPEVTGEPTPPVSQSVSVVITYADLTPDGSGVEAGAYAAIIDGPATCTLTLSKGSTVRTQTVDAVADVATMSCGQFLISRSDLSKGTWTAVVTYASAASSGQSGPSEVVVP